MQNNRIERVVSHCEFCGKEIIHRPSEQPRFGNVRIGILNDAPYFVGKDVAKALGYVRPDNAIRKHVHPADKQSALITLHEPNQCMKCIKRKMVIINESGVYSLVLSANTPDAQEFKHWVTSEVLPAIFANGSYSLVESPAEQVPEFKPLAKLADVFNFNPPTKPPAALPEPQPDFERAQFLAQFVPLLPQDDALPLVKEIIKLTLGKNIF